MSKFKTPSSDREDTESVGSNKSTRSGGSKRRPSIGQQTYKSPTQSGDKGETFLYGGERIPKSDKMLAAMGTIEELIAYIGVIKAEHLDTSIELKFDTPSSSKLFLFARLTHIQESLLEIMRSLGTSKKVLARFDSSRFNNAEQRITELEKEITDMNIDFVQTKVHERPLPLIPGTSALEARLFYSRALCRRAERQVNSAKSVQVDSIIEDGCLVFLNRLGDYFLALAVHTLHSQSKEPLKRTGKK